MLDIRKAEKNDSSLILDFIRLLAKYEHLENEVIATTEQLEKTIFLKDSSIEVFFAYEGKTPVGFMLIFQNYSTFLAQPGIYLEDLYVKEAYRGKGYGKKMLQFLARLAVERNCGRLEWAVLDWNKPAIDFYQSIGAKLMNSWIINRLTGADLKKLANAEMDI